MRLHLNPGLSSPLLIALGLAAIGSPSVAQIRAEPVIHALEHVCIPAAGGGIEGVRASANAHGYTSGGAMFGVVQPTTSLMRSDGATQVRIPQFAPGKACGFNVIELGAGRLPRADLPAALAQWGARQSPPFVQIGNNYDRLMEDGQRMSAWQRRTPQGVEILNVGTVPPTPAGEGSIAFTVVYSAAENAGPSRPLPPPARPLAAPPPPPAATGPRGQAEQAGHTPRILTASDTEVAMYAGPTAVQRPAAPVTAWMWLFLRSPGTMGETTRALRMRMDCVAHTTQVLGVEVYDATGFKDSYDSPRAASRPSEGSTAAYMLGSACDPSFHAASQAFVDWRAARAAADTHFRSRPAASPDAGAARPSAPPPTAAPPIAAPVSRAELTRGPFRLIEANSSLVRHMAGARVTARPTAPIDRWVFATFKTPLTTASGRQDGSAQLIRFDCAARTSQVLETESFLEGRMTGVSRVASSVTPESANALIRRLVVAACDADAPIDGVASDLAVARRSAREMLTRGQTYP